MKLYLDNDVVSAIVKDDDAPESSALDRLLAAYGDGEVDLVTSMVTLKEIERYQGPQRPAIERIFRLLKEVPNACIPMIRNDPLYDDLLKRGLEDIDAWHVFVAAKNGCHAFLTCDRLIHHYAAAIRQISGLVVQKPSDFVARTPQDGAQQGGLHRLGHPRRGAARDRDRLASGVQGLA